MLSDGLNDLRRFLFWNEAECQLRNRFFWNDRLGSWSLIAAGDSIHLSRRSPPNALNCAESAFARKRRNAGETSDRGVIKRQPAPGLALPFFQGRNVVIES